MKRLPATLSLLLTILHLLSHASCVTIQEPVIQKYTEVVLISENYSETYTVIQPLTSVISADEQLIPHVLWSNPQLKYGGQKYVWYYGYDLTPVPVESRGKLRVILSGQKYYEGSVLSVFDMTQCGQILNPPLIASTDNANPPQVSWRWISMEGDTSSMHKWLNLANIKLNHARLLGAHSKPWFPDGIGQTLDIDTRDAREIAIIISGPTIPQNVRFTALLERRQIISENSSVEKTRHVPFQREVKVEKERPVFQSRQVPFWDIFFKP